jgi:hypothetical protein
MTTEQLVASLAGSREFFHRHLLGMSEEQLDWKPYPHAFSAREMVAHMAKNDLGAIKVLEGPQLDLAGLTPFEALAMTGKALESLLEQHWQSRPQEALRRIGGAKGVGRGISYRSMEDYYHAGQIAYIRQAIDPSWDQDNLVYGDEE